MNAVNRMNAPIEMNLTSLRYCRGFQGCNFKTVAVPRTAVAFISKLASQLRSFSRSCAFRRLRHRCWCLSFCRHTSSALLWLCFVAMPGVENSCSVDSPADTDNQSPDVDMSRVPGVVPYVALKLKCQGGAYLFFKHKATRNLRKLLKTYCNRESLDFSSTLFFCNGRYFQADQTPAELGMEDDDEICAIHHAEVAGSSDALSVYNNPARADPMEMEKPRKHCGRRMYLKVNGQVGRELLFKVTRTRSLRKLMKCYCKLQSLDPSSVLFLFDGRRIRSNHTPARLRMKDRNVIHAVHRDHQTDMLTKSMGGLTMKDM